MLSQPLQPLLQAIRWENGVCILLDQTKLPHQEVYLPCKTAEEVIEAIRKLKVRGAPAIGIAGAYAAVLAVKEALQKKHTVSQLAAAFEKVKMARPTAVNLQWSVARMRKLWDANHPVTETLLETFLKEAQGIHQEDIECNRKIATRGATLLPEKGAVLTCCNTGDLATGGVGTAFGVIREGFRQGKVTHVYACETRPVLQGLRLTAFELEKHQIPYTILCDNMAGTLIKQGKVQSIITGADRIAANGDSANKIGTYPLAVLAKFHQIPFFIAAPFSTFDLSIQSGEEIPIEERAAEEVISVLGGNRPAYCIPVLNPAFDVTPHSLISAILCDRGNILNPTTDSVHRVMDQSVL